MPVLAGITALCALIAVGVVLLAAFVRYELRTSDPVLPLRLFRNRGFTASNVAALFIATAIGYFLLGIGGALWILFLGRIIDGLTAGNQSALFAYIADVTKPQERSRWYGLLGGAIGVGFMIGPAIGGLGIAAFSIGAPPVRAPNSTTCEPGPSALASLIESDRSTPTQSALTSGLPA